ncbi:hypothetical protein CK203_045178 [Vitis vinifera]|uniref:Uncharacterized protein n=1 Tax=Vitis vinifera TaxID=29760 RepID=A0A438H4M1_VITVI|nr:hypothetical protein CK203_045178 [Vitis vinifera]
MPKVNFYLPNSIPRSVSPPRPLLTLSSKFPDILNCSKLEHLLLKQNFFVGPIPADIDRLSRLAFSPSKRVWRIEEAEISVDDGGEFDWRNTGELQQSIESGTLGPLSQQIGRGACLEWSLPTTISAGKCPRHSGIAQVYSPFSFPTIVFQAGFLPASGHPGHGIVMLDGNSFSGTLPMELTSLWNITVLLLDENQFSGELPSQIISWKLLNKFKSLKKQTFWPKFPRH